jgi:integrase
VSTSSSTDRRDYGSGTIHPRGPGKWLVRVSYGRLGDRRVRRAVTVTGTKADAKKVLRSLVAVKDQGESPTPGRLTVGEWLDHFTDTNPRASEATRRRMKQSVRLYTSDALRATKLRDLTPAFLTQEVEALRRRRSPRTGQPMAPRTVGIWFAVLRAALNYGVKQGVLGKNPAAQLGRPKAETESPERRWLTPEQIQTFLATAASDPLYPYFRLLAETGLRPAEGAALRWTYVDLDARRVAVRGAVVRLDAGWTVSSTKTHGIRTVPISADTVVTLRDHHRAQAVLKLVHGARYADEGLVFADEIGRVLSPFSLSKRFGGLLKQAGLESTGATLYSLRHSAATHRLHLGVDPVTIARQLGHANAGLILRVYGHAAGLDAQEAVTDQLAKAYAKPQPG